MAFTRTHARASFGALLWLAAAGPVALILLDTREPGAAVDVVTGAHAAVNKALWVAGFVAVLALLVWPPFLPALRLAFRRVRTRMHVDQAPLAQALARLRHHETADDHFAIAQVAQRMGDVRRGIPHAARALELDATAVKARHLLGRMLFEAGRYDLAAEQLARVVTAEPGFAFGDALLLLGCALEKLRQDAQARAALERHEQAHGADRRALLVRAKIARRAGERDVERELLRRAAAKPASGEIVSPEAALARARARVALWMRGRA